MLTLVATLLGSPPPVLVEETGDVCECAAPPVDGDGDGFGTWEGDCDDADSGISRVACEQCDGIDNN